MNFKTKLNMNRLMLITLLVLFGMTGKVNAQEEKTTEALSLSGSVDTYFRTGDPDEGASTAPATSFANGTGFSLGMINIIGTYEGKKSGFVADLVFGPRGADAVFASPASLNIVNQLYAYLNVSDKVTLTIGNFNTFLGYEVISPTGNYNYSTSYLFSYGPFSHTGFKADFDLGSGFSLMTGVFNPTDFTDTDPDGTYTAGAQLGYATDGGSVYLNLLADEEYTQIDLTTGWDVSEKAYLGFNATYSDLFYGAAIYTQLSTSDAFSLGIRAEYFADEGAGAFAKGESMIDLTLSANYKVDNLTIIPELRIDTGSKDLFLDETAKPMKNLSSFLLAVVYSF